MSHRSPAGSAADTMLAAISGGLAAIAGGLIFVGGLLVLDVSGLQSLARADGWVRPLAQLGGAVGGFGLLGFALGPVVAATGKPRRDRS